MREIQIHRKRLEWKILIIVGIFFWFGSIELSSSFAAVHEVCKQVGCAYTLPSEAVAAAAAGDTILVHPGTYMETGTISITKSLRIIGDSPINTKTSNSTSTVFLINTTATVSIEIAGLQITGGLDGINVDNAGNNSSVNLHHNHIFHNKGNGITVGNWYGEFVAFNNIILSNDGKGIKGSSLPYPSEVIYNNIIAHNTSNGYYNVSVASYNSSYNNGAADVAISKISNIPSDCLFVDNLSGDYRLQPGSPCKDTGDPGYLDIDGSISDMGSFGGPAAAQFWPYWEGGPVITDLTVDPVYVPRGGTISINATGEIR